jgi:hypothetical protein
MATNESGPRANEVTDLYTKAINGMATSWPANQPNLIIQTVTYTPATFTTKLQAMAAPLFAAVAAKLALETALAARDEALPDAAALIVAFFAVLPQYLPAGSADVAAFGAKPKKARKQLTVEQKQVAAQKREATRLARHIMGKNQRLAIKAPAAAPPSAPPAAPPAGGAGGAAPGAGG